MMAPPDPRQLLPQNSLSVIVGSLCLPLTMAPPWELAEFPMNRHLVIEGLAKEFAIAPPPAEAFPMNTQSSSVGLLIVNSPKLDTAPPDPPPEVLPTNKQPMTVGWLER